MPRDHLFLLAPDFVDPAYPGRRFYCWHCALIEGVLAGFPALAGRLDVTRLPWPRPRQALIDRVGEAHQSLPLLVLAADAPDCLATRRHGAVRFIADMDAILRALHERHGIPEPHP
ncbi:DUF3088 domain-containing protein [Methylobacterium aquaticum]|uniref:DUF3088 domain-containing protein n=1 Tax=Methylobacterium aquaticum TaxID=270351 RepID=A0A0J6URV4_9HYPH|nr:DUF3088 domain-containing protein [Methylobacterium aquaticum]KMO28851.1 hypothetical protein VP06_26140 [Methylobacterium aquaticum]